MRADWVYPGQGIIPGNQYRLRNPVFSAARSLAAFGEIIPVLASGNPLKFASDGPGMVGTAIKFTKTESAISQLNGSQLPNGVTLTREWIDNYRVSATIGARYTYTEITPISLPPAAPLLAGALGLMAAAQRRNRPG